MKKIKINKHLKRFLIALGLVGAYVGLVILTAKKVDPNKSIDYDSEYKGFLQIFSDLKDTPELKQKFIDNFNNEGWNPYE